MRGHSHTYICMSTPTDWDLLPHKHTTIGGEIPGGLKHLKWERLSQEEISWHYHKRMRSLQAYTFQKLFEYPPQALSGWTFWGIMLYQPLALCLFIRINKWLPEMNSKFIFKSQFVWDILGQTTNETTVETTGSPSDCATKWQCFQKLLQSWWCNSFFSPSHL